MAAKQHLAFLKKFFSLELAAAMEYRFNFIAQTLGMFFNDAIWLFFWFILFQKFEHMNAWGFTEMALLYALVTISWGIVGTIFGNFRRLAPLIENGALDYYLTMPKNVLMHTLAKLKYSALGDLLFGIVIAFYILEWNDIPLFLFFIITGSLLFLSWSIMIGSITFFVGRFEHGARAANDSMILLSTYPFSVFSGVSKFILLFVVPAGFVAGVPIELLTSFDIRWFGILTVFTFSLTAFSIWLFYKGLHRYESGNVMAGRT